MHNKKSKLFNHFIEITIRNQQMYKTLIINAYLTINFN